MKKQLKAGIRLKALDDVGHGLARIATLSGVDSDGDTYAPGAFAGDGGQPQWATILAAHNWNHIPLGKAKIYEDGDQALAELHLNLDTQAGKDWYEALKFDLEHAPDHPVQEWSYGFYIKDAEQETRDGERVRVLKRLEVFEVSPVVRGAGQGTGTIAMKNAKDADLDGLLAGVSEVLNKRAGDPDWLNAARKQYLAELHAGIGTLLDAPKADDELARRVIAGQARRSVARHLKTD